MKKSIIPLVETAECGEYIQKCRLYSIIAHNEKTHTLFNCAPFSIGHCGRGIFVVAKRGNLLEMSVKPRESSIISPLGRRLALVVGVNGPPAPGRAPLQYAVDDGRDMELILQQDCCGFKLFHPPLLGEQATTSQVRDTVLDLADHLQEDDFALFFFSGHAEAMLVEAGLDDVYLVTHDFNPLRVKRDKGAHLSLRWLRQMLFEHEKAKNILIILDCCYAGKFGDSAPDLYGDELHQRLQYYFAEPGAQSPSRSGGIRLALTATGNNMAKERDGHGLLTGSILAVLGGGCEQAVNEQGQVTFTSLFGYLKTVMSDQSPRFFGAGDDLVLAIHPDLSAQRRREREQLLQREDRKQRLRTLIADHNGFLQDRLESFVGREQELMKIHQHIDALITTGGYLTITGQAGQGKSSIIAKLIESTAREQGGIERVAFHFIPLTPPPDYQVPLLRNLMARLILKYNLSDLFLASESRAALSVGFPRVLKEIADKGGQEIIFIDGLDQLQADQLTGLRDLSFLPQGFGNPPQGIVFVLGTRPNDTLRPLELLKPYYEYKLPNLSRADFDQILHHRRVSLDQALADNFYKTLDKNALYLDLVAKELAARKNITGQEVEEIVQQIANDPENLFSVTIDRLRWQETLWASVIKPVLGLLLVTNEPLVREHLKHLLNLDPVTKIDGEQLNRGLEGLGGLVIIDDQQRYSLFHLKFREYLRQDTQRTNKKYVFDREDEQHWHERFIDWCEQNSLTQIWDNINADVIEKGRRLYARQHYITHLYYAREWKRLFDVLDKGGYGRAKVEDDPSTHSYALDLDLGRKAAASPAWTQEEAIQHVPYLWRYTLLRCSLASRADTYFREAFQLMLLLGHETKALGLTELLTSLEYKAQIFTLVASHLARQAQREYEGLQLFARAEQVIGSISDERIKAEAQVNLSTALAQAQHWQEAKHLISSILIRQFKVKALANLSTALAQAQHWQEAEHCWQEIKHLIGSISDRWKKAEAQINLSTALAQAQHWQEAKRIIGSISIREIKAKAQINLSTALAQAQRWQEAKHFVSSISDKKSKAKALVNLGTALAQAQHWQEAGHCWQEAEQVIGSISIKEDKAKALANLGTALAQAQRQQEAEHCWQEAEQVIGSISDESSKAEALVNLGTALAQAQRWQEAKHLIGSISIARIKAKALVNLGTALAQAQHWQEAEQVIGSISIREIKAKAVVNLSIVQIQAQLWQEAEHCWQEAEHLISSISIEGSKAESLVNLSTALAQAQHWQEAEQVIGSISDEKSKAEALVNLSTALAQAQHWQEAEHLIGSISDKWRKAKALANLGTALAQAQRQQEAEHCWQEAEHLISSISDERSKAEALVNLGTALAQAQRWQEAKHLISSISDEKRKVKALVNLSTALAQAQHWQEAEQVIGSISIKEDKAEALVNLSTALVQYNNYHRLVQLVQQEWLRAKSREETFLLFPLAFNLLHHSPDLGIDLTNAFFWVDRFLQG